MALRISPGILAKLRDRHQVDQQEVQQCFENRTGGLLFDTREEHQTDPPTLWFVAPTNCRRLLKVCFIQRGADQYLRTAYLANADELNIYRTHGKPSDF